VQEPQRTPGVAFHRRLPRGRGSWWRLFVCVVLGGLGVVVMSLVAAILVLVAARLLGYSDFALDPSNGVDAGEMLATNLGLALLIPVAAGLLRGLYHVPPGWLLSIRPGLRWRRLWMAAGVSAVVWSPFLVLGTIGAAVQRGSPPGRGVVWFLIVVLLTTPLQTAGEESLFRGLILQSLGATRLPTWACCASSGVLFAVAHLQFAPPLFADRLLLGTVLAFVAVRTGGLEAGIAIHAVKNIAVLVPAGLAGSVGDALDPHGVTWVPLIVDAVLLGLAVPWILAVSSRRARPAPTAPLPPAYPDPPQERGGP
jgi:membrane protease YdiL (CAAX protease family)